MLQIDKTSKNVCQTVNVTTEEPVASLVLIWNLDEKYLDAHWIQK